MLARNRFDPEALVRAVNAVQLRGGYKPLQPLGETDIEVTENDSGMNRCHLIGLM